MSASEAAMNRVFMISSDLKVSFRFSLALHLPRQGPCAFLVGIHAEVALKPGEFGQVA
jgi:hypothetical protein